MFLSAEGEILQPAMVTISGTSKFLVNVPNSSDFH
jgi:hypothetical protein